LKRILLTGSNGFIGGHLQNALRENGYEVVGAEHPRFDLENGDSVKEFVGTRSWDAVIHLAGMSHVVDCEKNPRQAKAVNLEGTGRILEALIERRSRTHFIFASTAQVYAAPKEGESAVVFSEARSIAPQNFYAETKALAEQLIASACKSSELSATVVRLFNHTHKTQPPSFFLPHIYQQLKNYKGQPIPIGNLDLDRDIGSVRDLTRAFLTILEKCNWQHETFNICSGRAKNLRRLAMGLSERLKVNAEFVIDPSRLRSGEAKILLGSHEKLKSVTGWFPRVITEDQLLDDFLCD
jgi:nucleoside-diphosphate-sugar epimerase